jgi:hypothetical protein
MMGLPRLPSAGLGPNMVVGSDGTSTPLMQVPKTKNPRPEGPNYGPLTQGSDLSLVMLRVLKNMLRASQAGRRTTQPLLKIA